VLLWVVVMVVLIDFAGTSVGLSGLQEAPPGSSKMNR
jgi:hypothetical protein